MNYEDAMLGRLGRATYEKAMQKNNRKGRVSVKGAIVFGSSTADGQAVIFVKHANSEDSLAICKMIPKSEHYNRGLEKHHKMLVDVQELSEQIATVLHSHHAIERLTSVTYGTIMDAYSPFIDKSLRFDKVLDFIDKDDDGWVTL